MRILPESRTARIIAMTLVALALLAVLWFWVFPWLDRTFVNRPAIEGGVGAAVAGLFRL